MEQATAPEPILAPPGAGLPRLELILARLLFRVGRRSATRVSSDARIQLERGRIRDLIAPLDAAVASRRILIPRLRGLEDSSRYWSVWMVLDHLRIVNVAVARIVGALGAGIVPPGTSSTAAVKPDPKVSASVVGFYEQSCEEVAAAAAKVPDLNTSVRYTHPWFGPLDAAGWHFITGIHMGLHREQIVRILRTASGVSA